MSSTAVIQTLKRARALIAKGFTKFTLARDKAGLPVLVNSPAATSYCANGALIRVASKKPAIYIRALAALNGVVTGLVPEVNDRPETTKADVLRAFDRAIKSVRR